MIYFICLHACTYNLRDYSFHQGKRFSINEITSIYFKENENKSHEYTRLSYHTCYAIKKSLHIIAYSISSARFCISNILDNVTKVF